MKINAGKSFLVIIITIALTALILRFGFEQLMKFSIEQNEFSAQATLKLISTALENYAKDNQGIFPTEISQLSKPKSKYLDKDYVSISPLKGYNFVCTRLDSTGYECIANPVVCNLTGKTKFITSTGGLIVSDKCSKKD